MTKALIIGVSSQDGSCKEYIDATWRMLQNDQPRDYLIGTCVSHTVREVCQIAFTHVGLNWEDHVITNEKLLRPTEIAALVGDYSLAERELGWRPQTSFVDLIRLMVDADRERFQ